MKCLFTSLMIAAASIANAQAPGYTARMDSLLTSLDVHHKTMCQVALSKNGKIVYQKAIGYAVTGSDGNMPNTNDTKFRIGSITKMFTAVMVFQLIEEKKLTLDTKLATYFPEIPNAKDITIALMLNHHSGIKNFTEVEEYQKNETDATAAKGLVALIAKQQPAFKPGEKGEYSNSNYALLARIVEKITGHKYDVELEQRIIRRIGLRNTYNGGATLTRKGEAMSYLRTDDNWEASTATAPEWLKGAGGIVSTASDLNQFITALFNYKLVSKASLDIMKTTKDNYGSGLFPIPFDTRRAWGHSGRVDGYTSSLGYFPDDGVAFAIIVNGQQYPINDIAIGALSIYYGHPYKIPDFKELALSADVLTKYEGTYASKDMPLKITITKEGTHLNAQATGQSAFPLVTESDTRFTFQEAGIILDFSKNNDGTINKMILNQGGAHFKFEREN